MPNPFYNDWKVPPRDCRPSEVKTYKLTEEEAAKYKTEPYKKPSMVDVNGLKRRERDEMDIIVETDATERGTEILRSSAHPLFTEGNVASDIAAGLTTDDLMNKYGKSKQTVKSLIGRMETAKRVKPKMPTPEEVEKISRKYTATLKPKILESTMKLPKGVKISKMKYSKETGQITVDVSVTRRYLLKKAFEMLRDNENKWSWKRWLIFPIICVKAIFNKYGK